MTMIEQPAPDAELLASDGETVRLSDYWTSGPAAFVYTRYLGCLFCREQLKDLRAHASDIERAGLRLVVVTPDRPGVVREFNEGFDAPFPILSDPRRDAYQAYGLTEGTIGQLLNPHIIGRGALTILRGTMQGRPTGGPQRQLPGAAIVLPDGRLAFHHAARDSADHLSAADLIREANRLGIAAEAVALSGSATS